jgi:hypothetical protein
MSKGRGTKGNKVDTEVKLTVKKIFKNLKNKQFEMTSRKSDRVNVDTMLREYSELDPHIRERD